MINLDITKLTVLIQKKRAEVRLYNAYVTQSTSVNLVSHNKPQLCQAGNTATKL